MDAVFSAALLAELTAEADRQLAALKMMPMVPDRNAMDELRSLRSQLALL
jgi:hypothetical protein